MKLSERFQFDDQINLAHIDGHPVAGEVFDTFTKVSPPGQWFRISEAEPDGVIVIETKREAQITATVQSGGVTRAEMTAAISEVNAQLAHRLRRDGIL